MLRRTTGFISVLFFFIHAQAQDVSIRTLQTESARTFKKAANDTSKSCWKKGGLYNIAVGQGSLSNWAAGGDDFSLSIATSLSLYAYYRKDRTSWDNALDISYGYVKTSSLGSRKNDDRFDLLSKYGYSINQHFNLATLIDLRSQFFRGYAYTTDKDIVTKRFTSSFFSPAYALISQGIDYRPAKNLSFFASPITSRWIIVANDSISAHGDFGVPAGENSTNELGAFATINYNKAFNKYISYKGRLDIFSNYRKDPQNADLYMTNTFTAKFAKIIALTWNVDMIYDDDVAMFGKDKTSPALQMKSMIGIGLQVRI